MYPAPFYTYLLYLVVLFCTDSVAEGIYHWTDADGNVHYGDRPSRTEQAEEISGQIRELNIIESVPVDTLFTPYASGRHGSITQYVTKENHADPLVFTTYALQTPLLPEARLLRMAHRKGSIWFASDSGLIRFDKASEQWYLYDKRSGLPGDTVHDLVVTADNRLLLKIYDRSAPHQLINARHFWFDVESGRFRAGTVTTEQARTGGDYTVENSDILSNTIFNVLHYDNRVWITSATMDRDTQAWSGGVSALTPATGRGRQYTVRDGLAHPYCYDIAASENNSVWVTHWEPGRGLSILDNQSRRWKRLGTSRNGVALGGVHIVAVDHYILIGQQRALVIYDRQTGLAFELDESRGLPGHIVSDITVDDDFVWVSAYTYGREGSIQGGLMKIARSELDSLFKGQ